MRLPKSWRWRRTQECKIPSLLDTLQAMSSDFDSLIFEHRIHNFRLTWSDRQSSCNWIKISRDIWFLWPAVPLPFFPRNIFGCFRSAMTSFDLVKHKSTLHIQLCRFQIIYSVKQYTTFKRTDFNDHSGYLSRLGALVTWNTHCKLAWIKILLNFWDTLVVVNRYLG